MTEVKDVPLPVNGPANAADLSLHDVFTCHQGHGIQISLHHHIIGQQRQIKFRLDTCLLYTSPSPRDRG